MVRLEGLEIFAAAHFSDCGYLGEGARETRCRRRHDALPLSTKEHLGRSVEWTEFKLLYRYLLRCCRLLQRCDPAGGYLQETHPRKPVPRVIVGVLPACRGPERCLAHGIFAPARG